MTATGGSNKFLSLGCLTGADNYTVYWHRQLLIYSHLSCCHGTSYTHTGLKSPNLYYYIKANNTTIQVESNRASATTSAAAGSPSLRLLLLFRKWSRGDLLWMKSIGDFSAASGTSIEVELDRNTIDSEMNVFSGLPGNQLQQCGCCRYVDHETRAFWSTHLAQLGSSSDSISDVAVDSSDNIYVLGIHKLMVELLMV